MADDFGLKIGVEGEKEFKNALKDINQAFKVIGSEMNLVASQFDKNDKSIQALSARNEVLNKQMDSQKDKIETLRAALQNAADSFGESDRRTQSWAIQLNNAQAELNGMERELESNNKALESAGSGFDDAEKQADQFGDELNATADDADKSGNRFEKLGGILKGIGIAMGTALVAISTAAVGASKALTDMTVGASQYADDILTMSTVTGMSTDSLQAYQYAAELVDTSLETLTGSMARNVRSMTSARDGTGTAAKAYKTLGISVTDANGNLRDSETVYWEAIDALKKVSNETERDSIAMQLFGKSAQDLNPLIEQGSEGIAKLTKEAGNMGAVMSLESLEALGRFDDSMQRLSSGSKAAKNALGMVLLPQLQELADNGVGLLGEFTRGLNESGGDWTKISEVIGSTVGSIADMILKQLPNMIQLGLELVSSIGGAILANLPMLINTASQIITTLLNGLIEALPQITNGALQLVFALVDGIIANLPAIVGAALQMIAALAIGIAEALPTLIPAIVQAAVLIATTLIENLPLVLDAALQLILGLAKGLIDAIPQLVEALPAIITAILDFIISAIPQIIDAGIKLLVSLITALPKIIASIVAALPQIITAIIRAIIQSIPLLIQAGIDLLVSLIKALPQIIKEIITAIPIIVDGLVTAIIDNLPLIIQAGIELFLALIQAMPTIIVELVKAVPLIISSLVSAFANNIGKMSDIGKKLIQGLWQGISDVTGWLWNKVSGFFSSLTDRIKDFFGINSPSTLFAGLGFNMGEGIGVGFENAMKSVASDMINAIPTEFDVNAGYNRNDAIGSRTGYGLSGTGTTINQNISVVTPKALSEKELAREFKNLSQKLAMSY